MRAGERCIDRCKDTAFWSLQGSEGGGVAVVTKVRDILARRIRASFPEVCWLRITSSDALFEVRGVRVNEVPEAERTAVCVSVIVPTRDRPAPVVQAVASALAQDFENFEVVVVVDGEDPRTSEALRTFQDARVRVIELTANVGGAEARNAGVKAARGEWVAFLDDDDEWLPQKLSRQIVVARQSNAMWPIVSSRMIVRAPSFELIRPMRRYEREKPISEFLFCRRSLRDGPFAMQTSTLLARRDLMLAVPFKSGLKRHQDWDWVLRVERIPGAEFAVIEEPLVIYRTEDGRESVGRAQDWVFSMQWGKEMQGFFSARAYSWFLATECATRAVKSRAGFKVYAEIARRFVLDGRPSLGSTITMAAFLGLPRRWRGSILGVARRWRRRSEKARQRLPRCGDVQSAIGMECFSADQ
jgi:glycosyltransferase involved in cell wall biosynthesis